MRSADYPRTQRSVGFLTVLHKMTIYSQSVNVQVENLCSADGQNKTASLTFWKFLATGHTFSRDGFDFYVASPERYRSLHFYLLCLAHRRRGLNESKHGRARHITLKLILNTPLKVSPNSNCSATVPSLQKLDTKACSIIYKNFDL